MQGFSKEIKGLTKTDLMSIMRGLIRESQVDEIFSEFGFAGWYGKRKIYFIPFNSLQAVRAELVMMGIAKWWDSDREKQLIEKARRYKIKDLELEEVKDIENI